MVSKEQIQDLQRSFTCRDDEGADQVSTSYLLSVLHNTGLRPTDQELDELINDCDKDWRSVIKDNDFLEQMGRQELKMKLINTFKSYDIDYTGSITRE